MPAPETVPFTMAFLAGLLSFLSPCVLPLVPSFLVYITGLSFDRLTEERQTSAVKRTAITHAGAFILGFSAIFILFGASATAAGQLLLDYQEWLRRVGGAVIVLFGLYLMGAFTLPFLMVEKRLHVQRRPAGPIGTFLVGSAFAAGWTPCVGPILGSILLVASTSDSVGSGVGLLAFYSLGLGIPLFVAALGMGAFLTRVKQLNRYMKAVSTASGVFLIVLGILFFTNSFSIVTGWLTESGMGWYIAQ
ncbi:MAG: cytochrome c biogenesis CcdA family protein [Nitrospirota bacterium]